MYEGYGYNAGSSSTCSLFAPAGAYVGQWLQSFKEFPPRQKPGSFNLDRVMEAVIARRQAVRGSFLSRRAAP